MKWLFWVISFPFVVALLVLMALVGIFLAITNWRRGQVVFCHYGERFAVWYGARVPGARTTTKQEKSI